LAGAPVNGRLHCCNGRQGCGAPFAALAAGEAQAQAQPAAARGFGAAKAEEGARGRDTRANAEAAAQSRRVAAWRRAESFVRGGRGEGGRDAATPLKRRVCASSAAAAAGIVERRRKRPQTVNEGRGFRGRLRAATVPAPNLIVSATIPIALTLVLVLLIRAGPARAGALLLSIVRAAAIKSERGAPAARDHSGPVLRQRLAGFNHRAVAGGRRGQRQEEPQRRARSRFGATTMRAPVALKGGGHGDAPEDELDTNDC